jgi:hypothetical protein
MENDAVVRDLQTSVMRLSEELSKLKGELAIAHDVADKLYAAALGNIASSAASVYSLAAWAEAEAMYRRMRNG